MSRTALALAVLVVAAVPVRAEDKPWWRLVPDSYDGEIFSGTAMARGATEFHAEADGTLSGRYAFVEPDGTEIAGDLAGCRPLPARSQTLGCRWSDRYGAGTSLFVFEDDLQGFRGFWFSPTIRRQGMPWSGKRRLAS